MPFWELAHASQQDPHERTISRFTFFWHDFTLFWQDFGTIAQTGTPRMSWRDRSQKVRHDPPLTLLRATHRWVSGHIATWLPWGLVGGGPSIFLLHMTTKTGNVGESVVRSEKILNVKA